MATIPTMRMNILATLTAPETMSVIRSTPLISSRRAGRFSLKEVEAAAAQGKGNGAPNPVLEAAIVDCDIDVLQADASAAVNALAAVKSLEAAITPRAGAGALSDLNRLLTLLQRIASFLQATLARRAPAVVAVAPTEGPNGKEVPVTPSSPPGEIGSREDVLQALDKISDYYRKNEPSSPIPLFIERCKRLVTMSFIDIVRDLVPDAVKQVEVLKGKGE